MDQKRELSPEETGKVSGGNAVPFETDTLNKQIAIPEETVIHRTDLFGGQNNHPVYCRNCGRLLGYSAAAGTQSFSCDNCHTMNY